MADFWRDIYTLGYVCILKGWRWYKVSEPEVATSSNCFVITWQGAKVSRDGAFDLSFDFVKNYSILNVAVYVLCTSNIIIILILLYMTLIQKITMLIFSSSCILTTLSGHDSGLLKMTCDGNLWEKYCYQDTIHNVCWSTPIPNIYSRC